MRLPRGPLARAVDRRVAERMAAERDQVREALRRLTEANADLIDRVSDLEDRLDQVQVHVELPRRDAH